MTKSTVKKNQLLQDMLTEFMMGSQEFFSNSYFFIAKGNVYVKCRICPLENKCKEIFPIILRNNENGWADPCVPEILIPYEYGVQWMRRRHRYAQLSRHKVFNNLVENYLDSLWRPDGKFAIRSYENAILTYESVKAEVAK